MSQRRLKCTEAFGKEAPLLPCKQAQGDSAQRVCFSNSLALQGRLNNTKQPRQTSIQSCLRMEVLLRMSEYAVSRHPLILQDWLVVQSSSHQGAGFRTSRSSGASIPTTRFCGLVASMGEEGGCYAGTAKLGEMLAPDSSTTVPQNKMGRPSGPRQNSTKPTRSSPAPLNEIQHLLSGSQD